MKLHALSLIVAAMTLSACARSTEPVDPVGVIMPLAVGNKWIAEYLEYNDGGVSRRRLDTTSVERDTVIDGELRYMISVATGYVNRDDGLYMWGLDRQLGSPVLFFKYPASVGDEIRPSSHAGDSVWLVIRVRSVNESVTVPAGTFSCYHYVFATNTGQEISRSYLAPNVGFVKIVWPRNSNDPTEPDSTVFRLLHYDVQS